MLSIDKTLSNAAVIARDYAEHVKDIDVSFKGIAYSEMLFLCATVQELVPRQIVESGRAEGNSTLILARMFPDTQIVSIEYESDSPDAEVAHRRLKKLPNVAPLFGDARVLLQHIVLDGDVVLIDGPKRFRALRLAFKLLNTGKVKAVFLHDMRQGLAERTFTEENIPEAFFSDDQTYVDIYAYLDEPIFSNDGWRPYFLHGERQKSYFATLACIPYDPNRSYSTLLARATARSNLDRLARSFNKRTSS